LKFLWVFAVLTRYAVQVRSYRRFLTACRFHGTDRSRKSVINYPSTLCNIPEGEFLIYTAAEA